MSIRSRVIYWLRGEFNAVFGPDRWPGDRSPGRDEAGSASADYGPSAGRGRTRRSAEGAGQHRDPVLVRYYANLELPYGTGLDTVRRTWRRLVKKYHPDLYSADEDKKRIATELVQGLNRAYEELARHLERK